MARIILKDEDLSKVWQLTFARIANEGGALEDAFVRSALEVVELPERLKTELVLDRDGKTVKVRLGRGTNGYELDVREE